MLVREVVFLLTFPIHQGDWRKPATNNIISLLDLFYKMAIKQRSPTGQDPQKLQRRSHKAISAAPLLVASSFGQAIPIASSFEEAFQTLLKNPIKFVLATSLTSKDEARMAPVLRPRKRLNESHAQQQNRMSVRSSSSPVIVLLLTLLLRFGTSHRDGERSRTARDYPRVSATGQEPTAIRIVCFRRYSMHRNS